MNETDIRTFRSRLREIERYVAATLKDQTVCCGVTMAQCHVLLEFDHNPELTNVELSSRLGLDASTLSRTVDGLVRSGMIDRAENPQNRRSTRLTLTAEGQRRLDRINRSCDLFYGAFFSRIPSEKHASIMESIELIARLFASVQVTECSTGQNCQANPNPESGDAE